MFCSVCTIVGLLQRACAWYQHWYKDLTIQGAFTPNVKSMLSENVGGILGGSQC